MRDELDESKEEQSEEEEYVDGMVEDGRWYDEEDVEEMEKEGLDGVEEREKEGLDDEEAGVEE